MKKKILINALHAEEKRVAIVEGDLLVDFYVEASGREHLRGNVYKASVVRIEPGLQAAFLDFGQKRQGFLQMKEINPAVKVIFASGYLEPNVRSEIFKAGVKDFIQKPYDTNDILLKIRNVIDKT